ncbi:hypothetical protein BZA77DRAFT_379047 [Pyronema omphalodes]|nr:hypothetical protein BZA77DRAFT_379047 [Pyronema omphalodes]
MKFITMQSLTIALSTTLISSVSGSPIIQADISATTDLTQSQSRNPAIFETVGNIFKRGLRFEGQECKHGDFCFGTNCRRGTCRRIVRALGDDCSWDDYCYLTKCKDGKCVVPWA